MIREVAITLLLLAVLISPVVSASDDGMGEGLDVSPPACPSWGEGLVCDEYNFHMDCLFEEQYPWVCYAE